MLSPGQSMLRRRATAIPAAPSTATRPSPARAGPIPLLPEGSAELPWAVAVEPEGAEDDAADDDALELVEDDEFRAPVDEPVVVEPLDVLVLDPFVAVVEPEAACVPEASDDGVRPPVPDRGADVPPVGRAADEGDEGRAAAVAVGRGAAVAVGRGAAVVGRGAGVVGGAGGAAAGGAPEPKANPTTEPGAADSS